MLAAAEIDGDASKMSFVPKISVHNATGFNVEINFDNPEEMTVGGAAALNMEIKEVSVFKTLATLKPMDDTSFDAGSPELEGGLPPLIDDPDAAEELRNSSEGALTWVDSLTQGNFVLAIVVGSSMQELWGMIRALQMIALAALIKVNIPTHMHIYLMICIAFA